MMPGGPPVDEQMFEDPFLMQQLGLGDPYAMQMQQPDTVTDQSKPPPSPVWSTALVLSGILLMVAWIAIPLGGLGAWFYGPIEGVFADPIFTRWDAMIGATIFVTGGFAAALLISSSVPRVNWVENDPGMPRTTWLRDIEDMGGYYILTRRDRRRIRVRKDICSRYRTKLHVTANVLEINSRPGSDWDIEFKTTSGRMNRGMIEAEEDLSMRQAMREEQLEQVTHNYVQGQLEQIGGVM